MGGLATKDLPAVAIVALVPVVTKFGLAGPALSAAEDVVGANPRKTGQQEGR